MTRLFSYFLLFLSLSSRVFALDSSSHLLPRPLILELPSSPGPPDEETQLWCESWRVAAEANNLAPWKTIPAECADHVKDYMMERRYKFDLEMVAREASAYARSLELACDGKDAWVFDVDETLLSNLPYYADHGFGLELFNGQEFDNWVAKAMAPAIESSLKLYGEVLGLGFKIFLLTGRSEVQRSITTDNLKMVGFQDWEKVILRQGCNMMEGCNRCKEFHEHIYWDHKKTVRFLKTMVGDFSQRMCMPEKFVSQMKGNLSEAVDLRSPSGLVWSVGLTMSANKLYFRQGWKEFVEAHHLEENDILVFEYEGSSSFRVLMFDSSDARGSLHSSL